MSAFFYDAGDQCSSHEKLNTNARDCQQLVHNNNNAAKRLECRYHQSFYNCRKEWCEYLGECLNQTNNWLFHFKCRLRFKYYQYFRIIARRGKDQPLLKIDVNLCKTIYYRYSRKYDKIFTITFTEHKSGLGNIKNGLYKLVFMPY